jgi:superfamily II DNA/RNA helicase
LGPGFRFFNTFRVVSEKGKTLGYKNLDQLREHLRPVLLRRTRDSVKLELPERTTEYVRITPTDEQLELHRAHMNTVAQIAAKKYLTEMDLLRLRIALLMCRMSANSTYLVNKEEPSYSSKLGRLAELFDEIIAEEGRKVVLFSEWTTMLDLIERMLQERVRFVRLDGKVPQKKRQMLVHEFQSDPECRFFLTTNAGSTGLNLQAANTVINVDLPWNPAVLEQRIARAHRMGQTQPVQVFILITEKTIEESLLQTLNLKRDLALAALDSNSEVNSLSLANNGSDLRARLELLLGAKPDAPVDVSKKSEEEAAARASFKEMPRQEQVAAAGGALFGALCQFLGALAPQGETTEAGAKVVEGIRQSLNECVEVDGSGKARLTLTLPDRSAIDQLAQTLARLLVK